MRILRTGVFIHIYICIFKKNCKNPKIIIATNMENVDQSQGRKQKIGDQKLYVAVTRIINPYYFKLMVSCIRVGKQDTIYLATAGCLLRTLASVTCP